MPRRFVRFAGGSRGVAVLYSVANAGMREFWVKTAAYDRKFTEIPEVRPSFLPVSISCASDQTDLDESTSGSVSTSATATITFSPASGTTVTPSSLTLSVSSAVSGPGGTVGWAVSSSTVRVDGPGPVTVSYTIDIDATVGGGSIANNSQSTAGIEIGLVTGASPPVWGNGGGVTVNGTDTDSRSGSDSLTSFLSFAAAPYLNNRYALVKLVDELRPFLTNASGVASSTPTDTQTGSFSVSATNFNVDVLDTTFDPDDPRGQVGATLVFLSSTTTAFRVFEVTEIAGAQLIARLIAGGGGAMPIVPTIGFIFRPASSEVHYGLHSVDSGVVIYTEPPTPQNSDDWRKELVQIGSPSLDDLPVCLADSIYSIDGILTGGKLYTIAIDQTISGQTLRDRLQTSTSAVAATLTTRTALSGATCTLGSPTTSTVQVPSPGHTCIIEGITYLP